MNEIKLLASAFAITIGTVLNAGGDMPCNWDADEDLELEILHDQASKDAELLKEYLYKDTVYASDIKQLEVFETYLNENYKNYLELDMFTEVIELENETVLCISK